MNSLHRPRHLPKAAAAGLTVGGLTFALVAALAATSWGTATGSAAAAGAVPAPTTATLTSNSSHRPAKTASSASPVALTPNWAGPVLAGGAYDEVTATFVVPRAKCTKTNTASAFWAGLDGVLTSTVEQNGVDVICQGGTAYYIPWIEEFPAPPVLLQSSQFTVAPGDKVTVTTSAAATTDTFDFIDHTTGATYTTSAAAAQGAKDNTAECIAEAPESAPGKYDKLTDFGTVTFTQCEAQVVGSQGASCQLISEEGCPASSQVVDTNIGSRKHHSTKLHAESMATVDGGFVVTWHHS